MQAALQIAKDRDRRMAASSRTGPSRDASSTQHPILALQQKAGNQTVQQLLRRAGIQAKLAISQPDDPFEREADRVAERVMRMPDPRAHSVALSPTTPGTVQRKVPTGITLKEAHPLGHSNLKNDEYKKKFLTSVANVSLMQLTPPGDYTQEQQRGECTKESLTEVSNTCPATPKPFCEGDICFQVNQSTNGAGDPYTGTMAKGGPDSFVDFHRARFDTPLLDGSGKKQCSVVCHQLYKYRTEPDKQYHPLGAFYIIRNFRADKFTPAGSTAPINITTGDIRKVAAGSSVPSRDDFAKSVAPGLVQSGALLDAPKP
jgi:hypothetical protein